MRERVWNKDSSKLSTAGGISMENGKRVVLECRKMSKAFGPTKAVSEVDFTLYEGEIRGLIGENGSGKSTLCNMITGLLKPDRGEMFFKGEIFRPASTIQALDKGISILQQEAGTINGLSVAANVFLGREGRFEKAFFVNRLKMEQEARRCAEALGWEVDPSRMVDTLSFEERKLVEVMRVLYERPDILIVDETTSSLTQRGRTQIYELLAAMKKEKRSVIFITHDLQELLEVCDTITVLRDGRVMDTIPREGCSEDDIRQKMIGRDLGGKYYRSDKGNIVGGEMVLQARDISYGRKLRHVSFGMKRGEIVGLGGLSECGMHELGRVIFGALPCDTGRVTLEPEGHVIAGPDDAIRHGVAYIPKDRDSESIFLSASIRDNISVASLFLLTRYGLISKRKERQLVETQVQRLSVKMQSMEQLVKALSGGNKQKVAVAKWMANKSSILIMDCPTRGIDIGVKAAIYGLMESLAGEGCSILMISEELPELIGMSDRLIIMKEGRISGMYLRQEQVSESDLIKQMI